MKKFLLNYILLTILYSMCPMQSIAQNMLDLKDWFPGQGPTTTLQVNGQVSENVREWGLSPFGERAVIWKAQPDGQSDADGGWNSQTFNINPQGMYRFSVWIKKANSTDGTTYFGCANVVDMDGNANSNPYFWYGDLPALDKWYLLIGYVHGSGDVSTTSLGGIYDGLTGEKVTSTTDFKFSPGTTSSYHRTYLYYDPNVNDRQYFYAPRVDVVNGEEPSIQTLLGFHGVASTKGYFSGKVGILIPDPGDYELAVNGKIRAKEVKVETANWPDYVFADNYKITSLSDLEKYLKVNKHLPDMPSAKEIEGNGLMLGDIIKQQQKKIEELTLHLIEKDKQVEAIKTSLKKQGEILESLLTKK